jgi:hypothetical protein
MAKISVPTQRCSRREVSRRTRSAVLRRGSWLAFKVETAGAFEWRIEEVLDARHKLEAWAILPSP